MTEPTTAAGRDLLSSLAHHNIDCAVLGGPPDFEAIEAEAIDMDVKRLQEICVHRRVQSVYDFHTGGYYWECVDCEAPFAPTSTGLTGGIRRCSWRFGDGTQCEKPADHTIHDRDGTTPVPHNQVTSR